MIKVIVFDLWETLIPASIDFVHVASIARHEHISLEDFIVRYEKAVQLKKYKDFEALRKDFFKAFKQEDKEDLERELYEVFLNRFDKIHFYPQVESTLSKLKSKGYKLALLSNTESIHAEEIKKRLHFENYFDFIGFSFELHALKPAPKTFNAVLKKLKVKPSEALMIGNSLHSDIAGSKAVGMHSCWINRNERSPDARGVKPEFEIPSLNEIFKILGALNVQEKGRIVKKK